MQQFTPFESYHNVESQVPIPQGLCAENSFWNHNQQPRQENQASLGLVGWSKPVIKSSTVPLKKPKRILNAYNLFFKFHKQLIQEDIRCGRTAGFGNLARIIANRWRKVSPEEKAHFTQLYKLDKKRHETEMKAWKEEQKQMEAREQLQKAMSEEEKELICVDRFPFDNFFVEVDSNPHLVDPVNMQRLNQNLGEECTVAFLRAFLQ